LTMISARCWLPNIPLPIPNKNREYMIVKPVQRPEDPQPATGTDKMNQVIDGIPARIVISMMTVMFAQQE
jgi:hypothetical protein